MRPIAFAAAAGALLAPLAAEAACQHTPVRLDAGSRVAVRMEMTRDSDCTVFASVSPTSHAAGVSNYVSARIVRKPSSGIAGVASRHEWGYKPKPGFVGRDRFSVELVFVRNTQTQPQTAIIDVDVLVR